MTHKIMNFGGQSSPCLRYKLTNLNIIHLITSAGDFAVLIRSGMSNCKAAFFNFISALTAVFGFFIAVAVSTDEESRRWIFTLAAGMFLYIALADMVCVLTPELQAHAP